MAFEGGSVVTDAPRLGVGRPSGRARSLVATSAQPPPGVGRFPFPPIPVGFRIAAVENVLAQG
jgi:hypothetical protein